jgi:hypothetical protein
MGGRSKVNFNNLFKGLAPSIALGTVPSFVLFFGLYTPTKAYLEQLGSAPRAILVASALCALPASLVAVPADVLKKRYVASFYLSLVRTHRSFVPRIVTGVDANVKVCLQSVYKNHGLKVFFHGWEANLMKDIPFAALKMSLFEAAVSLCMRLTEKDHLNSYETLLVGFASGATTAMVTNPLDTINSRIKAGATASTSILSAGHEIYSTSGFFAFTNGIFPRMFIFGFGSSLFWTVFAIVGEVFE